MRPILLTLLWLLTGFAYADEECDVLSSDDTFYNEIIERMGVLGDKAPSKIEHCPEYGHFWKIKWGVFESGEGWTKRGEGQCWAQPDGDGVSIYSCSRSVYLAGEMFEREIRLAHDLDIELVQQLISGVRKTIGAHDRVTAIEYTPVKDGGAWSETTHGYQLRTSEHPYYQSGSILQILRRCGPAPCDWTVGGMRMWVQ